MLDIGFFELLVVGLVLIVVMGPERLPEVARKAAFFIRKARQGMFKLRNEMQSEIEGTPFADLEKAKREMADFKNDIKQFGRDLADSAEEKIDVDVTSERKTEASSTNTEGSLETAEGSLETAEGSLETAEGSSETAEGSSETAEGSSETAEGSLETAEGSSTDVAAEEQKKQA